MLTYSFLFFYDAFTAAHSRSRCAFKVNMLVLLLSAPGFLLSWGKCQSAPIQCGKAPGLIIDSSTRKMFVPAD